MSEIILNEKYSDDFFRFESKIRRPLLDIFNIGEDLNFSEEQVIQMLLLICVNNIYKNF